jgi:biopolymer transport protein TolR
MGGGSGRPNGIIEGINVTPLVDITLVLLLVFLVTAKLVMTPAVPLDLPKATSTEELQTIFSVAVPVEGPLLVDGGPVPEEELGAKAREALGRDPELRAVIQADERVPHGRVIRVLDRLKAAGIARVAFGASGSGEPAADPAVVGGETADRATGAGDGAVAVGGGAAPFRAPGGSGAATSGGGGGDR